jgi:hypothetical protein
MAPEWADLIQRIRSDIVRGPVEHLAVHTQATERKDLREKPD